MKKRVLYIIMFFALCFSFKVQGQNPITEYNVKLNSLLEFQAEILNSQIKGAQSSIFVDFKNQPAIYQRQGEQVKTMLLNKPTDYSLLVNAYNSELDAVRIITIEWNGTDVFTFPRNILSKFPSLNYVYIDSYENLSKKKIEHSFQGLIELIKDREDIEILYMKKEQPQ